ncbi:histidine phosphatase family protein [Salinithrix halophila]|uniref:Histidine phosphatase family protein n=1 Tax=Salinithrix halophila TaxID=1485204 RepID=A0ABV8JG72_9BACL
MKDSLRLLWVRHGETEANRLKQYCGHMDLPLNDRGRCQLRKAAQRLRELDVDRICASDLQRCRETAKFMQKAWPTADLHCTDALRELSFGEWEGLTYDAIWDQNPEELIRWIDDPRRVAPPGGETLDGLEVRLNRWLENVIRRHSGETIAVVTHGGPIRWFLSHHVDKDPGSFWKRSLPPGGWIAVEKTAEGWQVRQLGEERGKRVWEKTE